MAIHSGRCAYLQSLPVHVPIVSSDDGTGAIPTLTQEWLPLTAGAKARRSPSHILPSLDFRVKRMTHLFSHEAEKRLVGLEVHTGCLHDSRWDKVNTAQVGFDRSS